MSKSHQPVLLVPGETGWEVWSSGSDNAGWQRASESEGPNALEIKELPPGDLLCLFPVFAITSVPLLAATTDESLLGDLATMHAEKVGLRPDPSAGQTTDWFEVAKEETATTLLFVQVRTPTEGDLPKRSPKGFDISARAFPTTGEAVTLWREFGRWVFAFHQNGKLLHCQATSAEHESPDESVGREIRLAALQLSMQGIRFDPQRVLLWSPRQADPSAIEAATNLPVELSPRPTPQIPSPASKLLPADVRAARRAATRRRNVILAISAAALAYLGLIGWSLHGVWKTNRATAKLLADAEEVAPDADEYTMHVNKWTELEPVIDIRRSPVDILHRIAQCIPPNSGLRLKQAQVSATNVKLVGEAPELKAANAFSLNLTKRNDLAEFQWETPSANQSSRGWDFVYTAEIPTAESNP
jgi:hypothetical protein